MTAAAAAAPDEIAAFAEAIEQRFGHQTDARRGEELGKLLTARMKAAGARNFAAYQRCLQTDAEWEALAPLLTVPETYFWRMPDHFEALAADVLPRIMAARAGLPASAKTLRILSAGCASGEEAYTLRMLLQERLPGLADWTVEIIGIDLSEAALARARVGVYSEWSMRSTSEARRRANFTRMGKLWRLNASARAGVTFRRENLLETAPAGEPGYDVVFCRNVLIYFSEAAVKATIAGLVRRMVPGGYLFLGPAEALRGGATGEFALCRSHEVFYYRRKEADAVEEQDWAAAIGNSSRRVTGLGVAAAKAPVAVAEPLVVVEPLVLASALTEAGRYAEAETECRRVLAADARNAGAHFLLGLCYEQGGALEQAEAEMTRATYLEPGFTMAHLHRGLVARRRGDDAGAAKAFGLAMRAVEKEDAGRLKLFGGGFNRESLRQICHRELKRLEVTA